MPYVFPSSWTSLKYPHVRAELLHYVTELSDPRETAKWLDPDPNGPIIGIDQQIHFFFDDYDYDDEAIGIWLFDHSEVRAVLAVKRAIDAILETAVGVDADDRFFLSHPLWTTVVDAATQALDILNAKGKPSFFGSQIAKE